MVPSDILTQCSLLAQLHLATSDPYHIYARMYSSVVRTNYPHDRKGGGLIFCSINFWLNDSNFMSF